MPVSDDLPLSEDEVLRISRDIWSTMLGLDTVARTVPGFAELATPVYTGCVQITGSWEGAVVVDCPAPLARRAAAAMLGIAEDDCTASDLHDVVGEIANMTGGNLKAMLPGSCQLSLPAVTEGMDYVLTVPGATVVASVGLDCGGTPFRAAVHQRA
jgi:chemotaxis protein CheX